MKNRVGLLVACYSFAMAGFAQSVVSGWEHSIALCNENTVQTWGSNPDGELGTGTNSFGSGVPVQVNNLTGIVAVAAGNYHCLALKNNGNVMAWGRNSDGQLGNGTNADTNLPVQVNFLSGVKCIAAGTTHSIALRNDSTVWAWGENTWGQLGNGNSTSYNFPVQVIGLTGVIAISAGGNNALALKKDGTVWIWGANGGSGNHVPVQKSLLNNITAIACGDSHFLALKNDSTVWAWGVIGSGNGSNTTVNYPVKVSSIAGATAIAAGYLHCLVMKSDSTVWAWGWNNHGQLGNGNNTDSYVPVAVSNLTGVTAISAGGYANSFAIKKDHTAWAWGFNGDGELGTGYNQLSSSIPVQISGVCQLSTKIKEVAESFDGSVYPNPSSGIFLVQLNSKTAETKIYVRDILGNRLMDKNCKDEIRPVIDLTSWPKGIYFLEIISGDERVIKKIALE